MHAAKRTFRKPITKNEKFEGKTPKLKGHTFDTGYALQTDLYMKSAKEITQCAGRTCKQPEDIMGSIENLTELVLVAPSITSVTAMMSDPDDPFKIYLLKEIDLYLKLRDQYKENKTKMFNVIIGQCTDLMITKLESKILWKQ
eukprot:5447849-Ditylum_brightwellii.AAC.1